MKENMKDCALHIPHCSVYSVCLVVCFLGFVVRIGRTMRAVTHFSEYPRHIYALHIGTGYSSIWWVYGSSLATSNFQRTVSYMRKLLEKNNNVHSPGVDYCFIFESRLGN